MIELGANLAALVERFEEGGPVTGPALARRAVRLLDLTCLDESAGETEIAALCRRGQTKLGPVAAVCVLPAFVGFARSTLDKSGSAIRVVSVVNFPGGDDDVARAGEEAARAVASGAEEIDLVFPYRRYQAGERDEALAMVIGCRAMCGPDVTLKVILETGSFGQAAQLAAAAREVIAEGADFLKTSTGRGTKGATLSAAAVLLGVIHETGGRNGLKVSGGIREAAAVARYLALTDAIMGPDWISPATFRVGASALLDDLLAMA
ncbi:MAG: deoxyribose-phosphate aldolase [Rhodospirillaceae bacterium]